MATYDVQEVHEGRRASIENGVAGDYIRCWQVIASTKYAGPVGVVQGWISATGLTIGSAYSFSYGGYSESDPNSVIRKITPNQDSTDPCKWIVQAEYSSKWDQNQPSAASPTDRPVIIEYDSYEIEVAAERDRLDVMVSNSAGEQFDPPLMKKKYIRVIDITKNKATFDDPLESSYAGCVNDSDFTIQGNTYPAGTLRISKSPSGKQQHENGESFYAVNYRLEYDPDGWLIRALDCGYHYVDIDEDFEPVLVRFSDNVGVPTPKQMLLKDGAQLNGTGTETPGGDPAQMITFDIFEPIDFSSVGML